MSDFPDLLECAERTYAQRDREEGLPALSLYGWVMRHLDHEPAEWDPTAVHVSDYRYSLGAEEGGCDRQLYHRIRQDDAAKRSLWERFMFDQGFALQMRFSWLVCKGLPDRWSLSEVEMDVTEGLPGSDVGSCDLVLISEEEALGVEIKTQRGKAFQYADFPRASHEIQAKGELYALKRLFPARKLAQRIVYLDREGQNEPVVCPVEFDYEAVREASRHAHKVRNQTRRSPPEALSPKISVRENKGPNSIYLEEPWPCSYCQFKGKSCPGALPAELTELGIVAKGDHEADFEMRLDGDLAERAQKKVRQAAESGNVTYK